MGNERIKQFIDNFDGTFSNSDYSKHKRVLDALSDTAPNDLKIFLVGRERCLPTKSAVTGLRRFYTLHYVVSGVGYLECCGKSYTVKAGDVFLSFAGETVAFYPDGDDPWEYFYFSFTGILQDEAVRQMGFTRLSCVITTAGDKIKNGFTALEESAVQNGENSFKTLGLGYALIDDIASLRRKSGASPSRKETYVRCAGVYIMNNLDNVTVDDIAANCALSEEYLTRICRELLGVSLKELITGYRMYIARNWLAYTGVPIADIARIVGYEDKKYFVRMFRELFGLTPLQFRISEQEKTR